MRRRRKSSGQINNISNINYNHKLKKQNEFTCPQDKRFCPNLIELTRRQNGELISPPVRRKTQINARLEAELRATQTPSTVTTLTSRRQTTNQLALVLASPEISMRSVVILGALVCLLLGTTSSSSVSYSQQNSIAGLQQSMAQMLQVFNGNDSQPNEWNQFKLMESDGQHLLLGARNVVYNLSLTTMREQRRLEWPSSEEDIKMCTVKGKSTYQCQNYIRVLKLRSPDTLLVCGTNAYKPRCRTYLITCFRQDSNAIEPNANGNSQWQPTCWLAAINMTSGCSNKSLQNDAYELVSEAPGEGACPYQENQNSTSLFVDGQLYTGTAAQFSGIDSLIHRSPLRTEQFNPKQLNSPNFVNSFRYGDHVYFVFREAAIEHINCGKTIYSRIARVCINDSGGATRANRERWTSFVKARLNCSIPGEYPFYFNEVQASTQIVSSSSYLNNNNPSDPESDLLYAVFTTPSNSIGGSAVCAYRMSDVMKAFEGPFKSQADSNSNWLPVDESKVPQPRPGTCVNDSKRLPDENINFIKENPLMDKAIEAVYSQPLIMMASINFRFTQIAVDAQVETQPALGASSMRTDVIFVATDDGRVFKLINTHHLYAQNSMQQNRYKSSVSSSPFGANLQPYYAANRQQMHPNSQPLSSRPYASPQVMVAPGEPLREPLQDISSSTLVIEELHLFDSRTPIVNMMIHYPAEYLSSSDHSNSHRRPKLLVLSARQFKAIPLSRCERALTCADCLALFDPYCTWDLRLQSCTSSGHSRAREPTLNPMASNSMPAIAMNWFPANNLVAGNNLTLAWWSQCPSADGQQQQVVGAPFRSLFSSHLQVPSRFDYASGHHLSHTALLSVAPQQQQVQRQQQPVSECLTFCGGVHAPQVSPNSNTIESPASQLMMSCADLMQQQQHYVGSLPIPSGTQINLQQPASGSLSYSSENLYFAVISCALASLILGLFFGFVLGKNSRKHDSSVCSSTFDETNLYMASTGSHHNAGSLFAAQPTQRPSLLHAHQANGLLRPSHPLTAHQLSQQMFEANQCLLSHENGSTGNYGNGQKQQMIQLHLASNSGSNGTSERSSNHPNSSSTNTSMRTGNLPPIPTSANNLLLQHQNAPLVNTSISNTLINQSQLTPNSLTGGSISAASSTNTSSTSATLAANDQFYLNQHQLIQQQQQHQHQRSFNTNQKLPAARLVESSANINQNQNLNQTNANKMSNGKMSSFQQQQQQQTNKIYL